MGQILQFIFYPEGEKNLSGRQVGHRRGVGWEGGQPPDCRGRHGSLMVLRSLQGLPTLDHKKGLFSGYLGSDFPPPPKQGLRG